MSMFFAVAALSLLVPADAPMPDADVAFEELSQADNAAAIARIEANQQLEQSDPARLINLGAAYAREGRLAEARSLFEAAAHSENRVRLETATGEWVDSRRLAYRALAMLDGELAGQPTRMAAR